MYLKTVLIFLIIISIFSSCSPKDDNHSYIRNLKISELLTAAFTDPENNKLDSIISLLDDSISSYKSYPIESYIYTDTINKQIELRFKFNLNYYDADYCIRERNILKIRITKQDSTYIQINKPFENNNLSDNIKEFLTNPYEKPNLPEKNKKVIDFFGTVQVIKGGIWIFCELIPDSLNQKTSWKKLIDIVDIIIESGLDLKNELSQYKWNQKYSQLNFNKKVAISEYLPLYLQIFINYKPPPPPPIIPDTLYIDSKYN